METRPYSAKDSLGVKKLILSILQKEYPFDQAAYKDTDIQDISGTYGGKGNAFFVIEKNGEIVGTVGLKQDSGASVLLRRLFVGESSRGKGCGTSLLKTAVDFCKDAKYKKIIFRATDRMASAINLCKKHGFKKEESLEVSGFHIHTFAKTL